MMNDKPKISNKEVSWHEAVAAHKARKEAEAKQGNETAMVLTMLAAARVEKQRVGPYVLEPYSLAHSQLLEELENPLEIGGDASAMDIAAALLVFGERELLESLVASYGPKEARRLVYEGTALRQVMAGLTHAVLPAVKGWMEAQFSGIAMATGGGEEEVAAEAVVAAAEAEAAGGKE
jgi:hypothetical protein